MDTRPLPRCLVSTSLVKSLLLSTAMLTLAVVASAQAPDTGVVRETEALSAQEEHLKLHVPEGFEVQLFASEPMINKPINIAFDDRGRLWVSSTVEYPYAAKRERWVDDEGSRVRDSRDAIKILEDTDGDGKADKIIDFADGLNIPTGVLPWHKPEHKSGCIAWSIPNIWYLYDTTGDGKCDQREVLFGPLGFEKDTHGMCSSFRMGADGWVYGTHGFNNTSHFRVREKNLNGAKPGDPGTELDLHSGNVYRFRPDGSRIEIWSWGQVNPFGLTFDRRGNLYSADCHSSPIYQLLRGAHYPSFGKPHDGLGFGPAMIEHSHGSTGICGITYLDDGVWGGPWNDNVLIGNPVTSRINRDRIEFRGSTPVAIEQKDFVISDDPWFRPVDLQVGPDGALYVADFYNRIIGHYEVPLDHPGRDRERGRIWRIVKTDGITHAPASPEPHMMDNPLVALKSDSPFVRRAAAVELQFNPKLEALNPLRKALDESPFTDTHLQHALRMAIREQLKLPNAFKFLTNSVELVPSSDSEYPAIALGVGSPEAAAYLYRNYLHGVTFNPHGVPASEKFKMARVKHIARYGDADLLERLLTNWQLRTYDGEDESRDALPDAVAIEAIQQGLEELGMAKPNPQLLEWAQHTARVLLNHKNYQAESKAKSKALGQLASILKITAPVDLRDRLKKYLPPSPAPPPLPVSKEQRKLLDQLITSRARSYKTAKPDFDKGAVIFTTNCAACHQIGGKGGLIGPQLDGIGARGVDRLCEDILDPNRNVDAHFHLNQFTLKDGSSIGGFVRSDSAQVIRLIDAAGQEHRVTKSEIEKKQVSPMSLMPPAFGQTLSEEDFRNLLGYLLKQ